MNLRKWTPFWLIVVFGLSSTGIAMDFAERCGELVADSIEQGTQVAVGQDDWLFLVPELRHLAAGPFWGEAAQAASRARTPEGRDPLPAILDFHNALQEIGIQLLLVPVPPKAVVYGDRLMDGIPAGRHDDDHQAFYQLLRQKGVQVLDLTDHFLKMREHEKGPMYCQTDTHWSGIGVVEAARQIAAHVTVPGPETFVHEWIEIDIVGDLTQMRGATATESIRVRRVHDAAPDAKSPVILLGDSHTLVFHAGGDMHASGAGLPEQLAVELGTQVDLIGVRGSGATPARINLFRRAQRDPNFWSGKQTVIWVFSAREFTESDGWRIVPIQR